MVIEDAAAGIRAAKTAGMFVMRISQDQALEEMDLNVLNIDSTRPGVCSS